MFGKAKMRRMPNCLAGESLAGLLKRMSRDIKYFVFAVTCGLLMCASAETAIIGNIKYIYDVKDSETTLLGVSLVDPEIPVHSLTVPSTLGAYAVTSLSQAFRGRSGFINVALPNTVKDIGYCSFLQCSDLESMVIPDGVTNISTSAFADCVSLRGTMRIPGGIKNIGQESFRNCTNLTRVVILAGVENIGGYAFMHCHNLQDVTIPNTVTNIGYGAFSTCWSLSRMVIPDSVKSIGGSLFSGSNVLQHVTLPQAGVDAFEGMYLNNKGMEIVLSHDVTTIGEDAFRGKNGIRKITIPESVTSIGPCAFYQCAGLTRVAIPNEVRSVEDSTFYGCHALEEIVIPNSVTNIGRSAFTDCRSLKCVEIPNGVMNIGHSAFKGCTNLTSMTIPHTVTNIDGYAFYDCKNLKDVTIHKGVKTIGQSVFSSCNSLNTVYVDTGDASRVKQMMTTSGCNVKALTFVEIIDERLFTYDVIAGEAWITGFDKTYAGALVIPSSLGGYPVTSIRERAFYGCSGLTSVTIPSSVTGIGDWAFSSCSSLVSFIVDEENCYYKSLNRLLLTKDGKELVAGVNGAVIVPSGVTSIGASAFSDREGLTSVTIPTSVTNIGFGAFSGCYGLGDGIVVRDGWVLTVNGECPSEVKIPEGTKGIAGSAFEGCSRLTSIRIPSGVMYIGDCAFLDCCGLMSIAIPSGVTSIGYGAFCGCRGMTSVTIPASVTALGDRVFSWCEKLTSVYFLGNSPGYKNACCSDDSEYPHECLYEGTPNELTTYVVPGSTGWNAENSSALPVGGWPKVGDYRRRIAYRPMPPDPEPDPEPEPEPDPEPDPSADLVLFPDGDDSAMDGSAAQTYSGWLCNGNGVICGTVETKIAKAKVDRKTGATTAKVTGSFALASGKERLSGTLNLVEAVLMGSTKKNGNYELNFTGNALNGYLGDYEIVGARNVFAAKDKESKQLSAEVMAQWKGSLAIINPTEKGNDILSVSIGTKGKTKVSGTLANGTKVSASTQLVVGDGMCAVSVYWTKKGKGTLAFTLWLGEDDVRVAGLSENAIVGSAGGMLGTEVDFGEIPEGYMRFDDAKSEALKLKVNKKTGAVTGSFKLATEVRGRVKKVSVKVTGLLIDGTAYCTATISRVGSWSMMVE